MGTLNLTCLYADGEFHVAQYCQWDGYPSCQGLIILDYLLGQPVDDCREKYDDN